MLLCAATEPYLSLSFVHSANASSVLQELHTVVLRVSCGPVVANFRDAMVISISMPSVPPPHLPAGGAWTIGYKAWGALLGRRLSAQGVMVACLDYRNFPQVGGPRATF